MARIKYGGIITDISGSVGGSTFQKSLFGNTLRNKPNPHKSATQSQLIIRSYMFTIHSAWRALSGAQRVQWNRYINFSGQTIKRDAGITMTGHDLFIKYNYARLLRGLSVLSAVSYISMPTFPVITEIFNNGETLGLNFSGTSFDITATLFFILKLSSPRLPSLVFNPSGLRYITCVPWVPTQFDLFPSYFDIFGFLPSGSSPLHYTFQAFSSLAPVYSSIGKGVINIVQY